MAFNDLPVGTLDHSQTYNVTMPTAQLTVSVRDASGNPITGGRLQFDNSYISPLPGLPGTIGLHLLHQRRRPGRQRQHHPARPRRHHPGNPRIVLSNGLVVPFKAPVMNGDQSVTVTVPASIQVQGTLTDARQRLRLHQRLAASPSLPR